MVLKFIKCFSPLLIGVSPPSRRRKSSMPIIQSFSPLLIGVSPPSGGSMAQKKSEFLGFSPLLIGVSPPSMNDVSKFPFSTCFSPLLIGVSPPSLTWRKIVQENFRDLFH